MPIVINTNLAAMNAQGHLTKNTSSLNKSLEKLASGFRINRGADDAAGLQISESLRSQVRGMKKALDNTQDAMNVTNIMDGALGSIVTNLQRIRELTVQAANDTNATNQRAAIEQEVGQLAAEITRISDNTQFNGKNLLSGSVTSFVVQIGANASETLDLAAAVAGVDPFANIDAASLAVGSLDYDGSVATAISGFLTTIDTALNTVNTRRGALGAIYNRLESASQNLMLSAENVSSSESRIRDLDVASESANMVKSQILQQASATVLSQANQSPSLALSLLG